MIACCIALVTTPFLRNSVGLDQSSYAHKSGSLLDNERPLLQALQHTHSLRLDSPQYTLAWIVMSLPWKADNINRASTNLELAQCRVRFHRTWHLTFKPCKSTKVTRCARDHVTSNLLSQTPSHHQPNASQSPADAYIPVERHTSLLYLSPSPYHVATYDKPSTNIALALSTAT